MKYFLLAAISNTAFAINPPECKFLKKKSFSVYAVQKPLYQKIFREKEPFYFNNAASAVENEVQNTCRNGLGIDYIVWSSGCQRLKGEDIQHCNRLVSYYVEYAEAYRAGVKDAKK